MSARVFHPVVMSEMRLLAGGSGAPASATGRGRLGVPDGAAVARVRRDLFGPVDHEDSRRFVERELAAQQARDADRWGFDFARECPRRAGPGTGRYMWERVAPREPIPEAYALRHMPYLSRFAATATTTDEAEKPVEASSTTTTNNIKQPSIADYLKNRKRTCNAIKSSALAPTEPKKTRMSNS